MTTTTPRSPLPPAASLTGWLSILAATGTALLAVAHSGVDIPFVSALGPGGDRAVVPAAIAFAAGSVLYLLLAVGFFTRARWAWPAGLLVNVLAVVSGVTNYRGIGSAVGIAIAAVILVVLVSPGGRKAFRSRR